MTHNRSRSAHALSREFAVCSTGMDHPTGGEDFFIGPRHATANDHLHIRKWLAEEVVIAHTRAARHAAVRLAFAELERSGLVVRACDKGVDAVTARSGRRGPILCPRMYRMPGSAVFHSPCPPGNNRGADRYLCPPSRGVSELTAGRRSRID